MNVLNYIKNENYYVTIDSNLRSLLNSKIKNKLRFTKSLDFSYKTLLRILKKADYWTNLQDYFNLCELLSISKHVAIQNITRLKTKNSFPITTKNININSKELFRILGHLLGDGGIHVVKNEGKFRAFYVNNEQVLLNSFQKDVKSIFGDVKLYSRARIEHGDEIWLPSTVGYMLYQLLKYEKLNNKKRTPEFVFNSEESLICSFLQAIFDDEGSISVDKHTIVISLGNKELLEDIRNLLLSIYIKCNPIRKIVPKNRSIMYRFSITSKNNILRFNEKVGFKHPLKLNRLNKLVSKYR